MIVANTMPLSTSLWMQCGGCTRDVELFMFLGSQHTLLGIWPLGGMGCKEGYVCICFLRVVLGFP